MSAGRLQKILLNATLLTAALTGCADAPPAPPRQLVEYARQTSVGLEKYAAGHLGEARNAFRRALAQAELDDDPRLIATALLNLGAAELLLDDTNAAGRACARASREALTVGDAGLEWRAMSGLAEATRRLGQPARALALLDARPGAGRPADETANLLAEISRGRALADLGHTDEAQATLAVVIATARLRPAPDHALASGLHALATVRLATGRADDALTAADEALAVDRRRHSPPAVAEDHRLLGEIAATQGKTDIALQHFERARAIFSHTGQTLRLNSVVERLQQLSPRS